MIFNFRLKSFQLSHHFDAIKPPQPSNSRRTSHCLEPACCSQLSKKKVKRGSEVAPDSPQYIWLRCDPIAGCWVASCCSAFTKRTGNTKRFLPAESPVDPGDGAYHRLQAILGDPVPWWQFETLEEDIPLIAGVWCLIDYALWTFFKHFVLLRWRFFLVNFYRIIERWIGL